MAEKHTVTGVSSFSSPTAESASNGKYYSKQVSTDSGIKDLESSLEQSLSPSGIRTLEPFREDAEETLSIVVSPEPPTCTATHSGTAFVPCPGNVAGSSSVNTDSKETQLGQGSTLVVGCSQETLVSVSFPARGAPPEGAGDLANQHKILGLEEKLQTEILSGKQLQKELEVVTHEKELLEQQLEDVRHRCNLEVEALKKKVDDKNDELQSCEDKLAKKEKELHECKDDAAKKMKEARAETDKKIQALTKGYELKLAILEKEANKKEIERLNLEVEVEKIRREGDNRVKDLEKDIEIKKREIAEKATEIESKKAAITGLQAKLRIKKEREEKEEIRRQSEIEIKELKQCRDKLLSRLEQCQNRGHESKTD